MSSIVNTLATTTQFTASTANSLSAWLDYWQSIHHTAIDMGLERIRPVAQALGVLSDQQAVKPLTFLVAGTNGKGSTSKTIASIYHAAGKRVGLYQSPHLLAFNERILLDMAQADDQTLVDAFVQVENARQVCELSLSFFEATTLAAFVVFTQQACDIWVLEVGLGGRLDAVNLLDADVAVITNIGLDHTDWLGNSIEEIAVEKAGIMRPNIPVIYGDATVPNAICHQANTLNCNLTVIGQDVFYHTTNTNLPNQPAPYLYYACAGSTLLFKAFYLAAPNIATAISAVLASPCPVSLNALQQGVAHATMVGRFDVRQMVAPNHKRPQTVIFDVAHNVHGMQFLLNNLAQFMAQQHLAGQIHFVWSMLADKDIAGVVSVARSVVNQWHVAALPTERAASLEQLTQQLCTTNPAQQYTTYATIGAAFLGALATTNNNDVIVVCGSFYTVQYALEAQGK